MLEKRRMKWVHTLRRRRFSIFRRSRMIVKYMQSKAQNFTNSSIFIKASGYHRNRTKRRRGKKKIVFLCARIQWNLCRCVAFHLHHHHRRRHRSVNFQCTKNIACVFGHRQSIEGENECTQWCRISFVLHTKTSTEFPLRPLYVYMIHLVKWRIYNVTHSSGPIGFSLPFSKCDAQYLRAH